MPPTELTVDEFVGRVGARLDSARRMVIGIAGPPGAGKSTLGARLAGDLGAVVAPMDGFHRRNDELERMGLLDRKGAPETFDAAGFVAAVDAVAAAHRDVRWPAFDRELDEPVADAVLVAADARLVVIEGNYLLLSSAPWGGVARRCDEVAYLDLDPVVRVERLVARHVAHGRSTAEAIEFVRRSDETNAALVVADRHRASVVVRGA